MISSNLNRWLWKWHVIAGVLSLPFMFLLTVTGGTYLFKDNINNFFYDEVKFVEPQQMQRISYEEQASVVYNFSNLSIGKLVIPRKDNEATQFQMKARGHAANSIYVNPYNGEVTGQIDQKATLMYKVRKLHGQLLLGKWGEFVVELIASWFVVLLITGLVIWFPFKKVTLAGFFTIRFNNSKRLMWRDFHAVFSFWISLVLIIIIAGGMPWTQMFGDQLKWVQKQTGTGYPMQWRNAGDLKSSPLTDKLSIDQLVDIASAQQLKGNITIKLPQKETDVFSVSNRSLWLSDQKVIHFDQYSGEVLKVLTWDDVGILMDIRQVFMKLHQGQYGAVNLWVLVVTCIVFFTASIGGFVSYLMRRPTGQLGVPKVPESFKVSAFVVGLIILLGFLFPMFGLSVVAIVLIQWLLSLRKRKLV